MLYAETYLLIKQINSNGILRSDILLPKDILFPFIAFDSSPLIP